MKIMAFPEKLKALRLENGLTQDELGEKLYLSRTSISYYEQGKFEPNIETIIAVADLFNITTDELLR
jgi:DNA-binding XRE family transcriptional regulator